MSRSGHLRDGRASTVAASSRPAVPQDDDEDDRHDDDDRSDHSDHSGDDDDAQQSSRSGGGGGGSTARRDRRAKKKAEEEKKNEILVDRTVIHEALIRRAIHKDLSTFYDSAVVPLESEIALEQTERLVLSYCNIYAIDNLAGFGKLRHLQLDNNIIDRISNLDHLANLTWLDLSFNHLREIRGLEALVKLTDLSLTDNEITTIANLDTLVNLNVLSIGNNQISDLATITPLRSFKKLRALNLKGNPVCGHDDYHNTVFAYLTHLKYLDHTVIESSQFAKARDSKLDQLLILEQREKSEEAAERERKLLDDKQRVLDSANLGGLATLFADMIKADTEHPKIRVLPGFEPLQKAYREAFQSLVDEFVADMLAKHALKTTEHALAASVIAKIQAGAVKESVGELDRYAHLQKKAFAAHTDSLDRGTLDVGILPALRAELGAVVNELLAIEMFLVEQCESILEEFEKNYMKMIGENVLRINAAFRTLIDCSNRHLSQVYDLTHTLLERYSKDDSFTDGDVDVKAILSDKDVLSNAVSTSHENQEAKIAAKEDEVREREEGNGKRLIKEMRDAHRARNRKRIAEIYGLKSIEEAAIAAQEAQQEDDDDQ